MPIIEEGSYMIYGDSIDMPIPAGFWPSMAAISKYVSDKLGATVEFPELQQDTEVAAGTARKDAAEAAELARKIDAGECTCECSCYSCDCEDCPFR